MASMSSSRFVLTALAVLATFASTAAAGKPKVESEITYRNGVEDFMFIHEGKVKSALQACVKGRTVKLYAEEQPGSFGSDTTNRDGEYRIELPGDGIVTDYYTKVTKEQTQNVICKAAESKHKPLT